jgi:methylamine dehydrogenase light chain
MNIKSWFDELFESSARTIASRSSRRSFVVKLGTVLTGTAAIPLLPVLRIGRAEAADPAPENSTIKLPVAGSKSDGPAWNDPKQCDYWAYCATDGWLCSGCGGTSSKCPPGTEPSPIAWIGTCKNPGDNKSYVVAYHDCCGKSQCQSAFCGRSEGDTPRYRPQRSNSITWCFGGVSSTYHCTVSRLMSVVQS